MSKPVFLLISAIFVLACAILGLFLAEFVLPMPQEQALLQTLFKRDLGGFNIGVFIIITIMPIMAAITAWQHFYSYAKQPSQRILFFRMAIVSGLTLSLLGFYLGITMPIFSGTKFWIFSQDISVMKSIGMLFESGEYFLGVLIFGFTLVLPAVKYLFLFMAVFSQANWVQKLCNWVAKIGKWSMLDVFVLAITIVFIKLHDNSMNISSQIGIVCFAIAVLSSMVLTILLQKLNKELINSQAS